MIKMYSDDYKFILKEVIINMYTDDYIFLLKDVMINMYTDDFLSNVCRSLQR